MTTFTDLDQLSIATIRGVSIDMVQKANSGHPGMPLGMAPLAHVLFSRFLNFNSANPKWLSRDRFVLSNGHGCALLYTMLHLSGYNLSIEDLQAFRQIGSKTPGHPENFVTEGVEVTTGPLGQGLSNAVGLAMASKHTAARFSKPNYESLFDNYVYVFCGDGCLMEGITAEASSLGGHLALDNLIVMYDDNKISIDGYTDITFTENVGKRYEAYGWHVQYVSNGDSDYQAMYDAIATAKKTKGKPHLICVRTTIGFGSKNAGTEKVHGAPLGEEDIGKVKEKFNMPKDQKFYVPKEVSEFYKKIALRGAELENQWNATLNAYCNEFADLGKQLKTLIGGNVLPADIASVLPKFTSKDAAQATRKLSQSTLNILGDKIPEMIGGSADLAGSNLTDLKKSHDFQHGKYDGRILRFGVREHAMAAICNGIATYGYIPFCATFLNFMGYMLGAARLSALSHLRVIYIMTHDSIGLGEDGPTHQPVEVLAMLRATPNFLVFRPADGNEVSGCYLQALLHTSAPSCLALTRQDLPQLEHSSIEKVALGGYVVLNEDKKADLVFVATGSEVSIAIEAAKKLAESNLVARVVSMPCTELFEKQSKQYQDSVLLGNVPVISVEAATTFGWDRFSHVSFGIDTFGKSGPFKKVYEAFGLSGDLVAQRAQKVVEYYKQNPSALGPIGAKVKF